METVKPLQPIAPASNTSSQGKNRKQRSFLFSSGIILQAKVIADEGDNTFVLDFARLRLKALADAHLTVGQSLQLQVKQMKPQLIFEIIEDALPTLLRKSLTLLDKNIDLSSLIESQEYQLGAHEISSRSRQSLERYHNLQQSGAGILHDQGGFVLKELLETLGLQLEAFLARDNKERAAQTLKASLSEIRHTFFEASNIARDANRLLAMIEMFQLIQLQGGNDTLFILPLPFPFLERGYLVVAYDHKESDTQGEEKTAYFFSLHLTIEPLGNMRIDFELIDQVLCIRIRSVSQEVSAFIAQYQEELRNMITLTEKTRISFAADAPDPIHELLQDIAPQGHAILDTVI